jgi:hypothetical protein
VYPSIDGVAFRLPEALPVEFTPSVVAVEADSG